MILWLIVFLIILALGGWLIFLANGYKINWPAKKIQKTGMIYLKSDPKEAEIYLDGRIKGQKTPLKLSYLLPGRYTVEVKKYDYQTWSKTVNVESGQVEVCGDIVLFKQAPEIISAGEEDKKILADSLKKDDKSLGLEIKDSEIWWGDDLITRMSEPVTRISFWQDKKHLLFQIKNKIRIMDLDGSNNLKLIELSSEEISEWVLTDSGSILIYKDGPDIKKAEIK